MMIKEYIKFELKRLRELERESERENVYLSGQIDALNRLLRVINSDELKSD